MTECVHLSRAFGVGNSLVKTDVGTPGRSYHNRLGKR